MKLCFVDESWDDYLYWQRTDKKILKRLIKDFSRSPHERIGKPDALKHKYRGFWSRRMDGEHRLIYKVRNNEIWIVKCIFH